jgi:hypothetical protein
MKNTEFEIFAWLKISILIKIFANLSFQWHFQNNMNSTRQWYLSRAETVKKLQAQCYKPCYAAQWVKNTNYIKYEFSKNDVISSFFALPCFFKYLKFFQGRYDTQYTDTCHKDTQSNDNNVTQRKMTLGIHCC